MQIEATAQSLGETSVAHLHDKRVLMCADLYGPGGTENHLVNLCELLASRGAQVTVASRVVRSVDSLLTRLRNAGIRHVTSPFAGHLELLRASQAWAYTTWPLRLGREFDVLYVYGLGRFTQFMSRFVVPGGSVVWNPYGDPLDLPGIIARTPPGLLTAVVAESTIHRRVIEECLPDVRTTVLPALANTSTVASNPKGAVSTVRVAFLGRFDGNKGAVWLAERWKHLSVQPARLSFYGNGPDRARLEAIAADTQTQITIHGGWRGAAELAAILENTDLVALPSLSEGVPLTLLECMANGVPFVASDVGGIPTLADGNPDVRIAPRGELFERALEETVSSIRRGDVDGNRLRELFKDRYDPEQVQTRWCDFFRSC